MKWIVYQTTCTVNNKIYIGVHGTENPYKFDGYLGNGIYTNSPKTYQCRKTAFQCAVAKYGIKNFKRTVLKIFDTLEDALNLEAWLVTKDFIERTDVYNTTIGGGLPPKLNKPIYQYDLEGNFIQSYDSTSEAGRAVGTPHTNIIKCLQGARQTAGGFQWREEYKEHIPAYKKNQGFHRTLYQYTTDNKLIKEWDSVAEAARQLSHSKEYLATKAKGQSVAYGFRWSYELLNSD